MKPKKSIFAQVTSLLLITLFLSCSVQKTDNYNSLMEYANTVKIINTHEHQRTPSDLEYSKYNFWTLLHKSYLRADVVSAGAHNFNVEIVNNSSLDKMWELFGENLNFAANTSYYQHFLEGIKKCYNYNETTFTKEGIESLSEQIATKYENYESWFDKCFHKFNFETMFLAQYWAPHNLNIDTEHFTLIFQINKLIYDIGAGKLVYTKQDSDFNKFSKSTGVEKLIALDDYLAFTNFMIQQAKQNGAVGLKNSMAYGRSLDYEDIAEERAKTLFLKSPEINEAEGKELQDFLLHHILDRAAEYNLPVQIHTGYLAGNGNQLDNGKPTKLNNLFLLHPNTKFDLFHGGFPWTGEFVDLGKMFPNVYLNLVWLPQISKQRAVVTFDEMLDCMPYNKIFWGGDCHFIEETIGSLEFGKQTVCEVLAKRIENGQINETTAKEIISAVFGKNASKLYQLRE